MDQHRFLIDELIKLLKGGSAHASLSDALKDLPKESRSARPDRLPYSIWQLVEHIRIAQRDMLEFSRSAQYQSPEWPAGYWVKETGPEDERSWAEAIRQIDDDRDEFIKLLQQEDIYKKIPGGEGQTILREALQIADHNAYHVAEIIVIRRLLANWEP